MSYDQSDVERAWRDNLISFFRRYGVFLGSGAEVLATERSVFNSREFSWKKKCTTHGVISHLCLVANRYFLTKNKAHAPEGTHTPNKPKEAPKSPLCDNNQETVTHHLLKCQRSKDNSVQVKTCRVFAISSGWRVQAQMATGSGEVKWNVLLLSQVVPVIVKFLIL